MELESCQEISYDKAADLNGNCFTTPATRWHEPLWHYLQRLTGDDDSAADTLQDCWLRVMRALPRLRDPARLRPWLFGIARRAAMDRLRHQYAQRIDDTVDPDAFAAIDELDARDDDLALMHEELARMPIIEREVLVLFYLHELSLAQLAELLDVPVGTVKSRLFRARQLLRHLLTDKGITS